MSLLVKSVAVVLAAAALTGLGAGVACAATPTAGPAGTVDVTVTDTRQRVADTELTPAQAHGGIVDCLEDTNHLTMNLHAEDGPAADLTINFSNTDPVHVVVTEDGQTIWSATESGPAQNVLVPLP
ncbi:hypothetical protein [Pseudonocardia sp. N23]|uniref:hypothetical protein n=1 Tax=Pseudonocardia sp. N23 TaxID=1987376 RepID=UPI000BFB16B9|nr:hypothetical protein [Pseudonocardia sp. N23]GAY12922.1 hypothetical protein TOK_1475 [Pseudonocardia sp. N23]